MTKDHVRCDVRWMIRRDMPEVMAIEDGSFDHPWTEEEMLAHLREQNCIGMVAEHGERVVGFMIYELHKGYLGVLDFAVHPAWRRKGVGTALALKLKGKLSNHRRTRIALGVNDSSLDAHLFWRAMGFRATSVVRDAYADDGFSGDAYRFVYRHPEGDEAPLMSSWATPDAGGGGA